MLKKYPNHLDAWVSLLSSVEIPILATTHEKITEQQKNIGNLDLRDIAILIRHDPLLSLKLLKHQENKRSLQQTADVTTIEKILLMIGITGFFRTFGGSPHLENMLQKNEVALHACHQTCARAFFASQLAEAMGKYRRDIDPNEIVTAALLHETAEILLWQAAPELMLEIKSAMRSDSTLRSKDIQKQILGCTVNELQQQLSKLWHLPKILVHLADEDFSDEPRVKIVQLATGIARHSEWAWNTEYNQQDLIKCADFLKISLEEAHQIIVTTAVYTAKHWRWYGVQPSIARLVEY
ncbi:HDOD domain-containing protein [Deefgea rivuli]|uniref:HDOD domain-containing protein n=1 Tax=Deefgea rivuli TaxID=400948 RepID=UPI00068603C4|nr:HDOD domain-containing protein [Deefgea rivuli]